ncbi:hypothetical protein SeLEV6574_g06065 [Synchytrium endobioticum]|uniref:Uncharacterized protein n=1 Tax=Synchytrium endobioticum TaxID=286115 RepID=A0A507CQR7_9FUNG|nr:hypothetical protein SeLEV6574_g06065 [Synchytrium endobioticum]
MALRKNKNATEITERPASDSPDLTELDAHDADALDSLSYQVLLYGLCPQYASPTQWDDLTRNRGIPDIVWTDDELEAHLMQITNDTRFSFEEVAAHPRHFRHLLSSESLQRVQIAFVWNALRQVKKAESHLSRLDLLESILHHVRKGFMFGGSKLKLLHYEFARDIQTQIASEMGTKKPNDIGNEKYWQSVFESAAGPQPFAEKQYHDFLKRLQSEATAASGHKAKVKDFRDKYSLEKFLCSSVQVIAKITLPLMDPPPKGLVGLSTLNAKAGTPTNKPRGTPHVTYVEQNRQPTTPYFAGVDADDKNRQSHTPFSERRSRDTQQSLSTQHAPDDEGERQPHDPAKEHNRTAAIRSNSDNNDKQKRRLRKPSLTMSPNRDDVKMKSRDDDVEDVDIYDAGGDGRNSKDGQSTQGAQANHPTLGSSDRDYEDELEYLEQGCHRDSGTRMTQSVKMTRPLPASFDLGRDRERSPIRKDAVARTRKKKPSESEVAVPGRLIDGRSRTRPWTDDEVDALEDGLLRYKTAWKEIAILHGPPDHGGTGRLHSRMMGKAHKNIQMMLKDKARTERGRRERFGLPLGGFAFASLPSGPRSSERAGHGSGAADRHDASNDAGSARTSSKVVGRRKRTRQTSTATDDDPERFDDEALAFAENHGGRQTHAPQPACGESEDEPDLYD